MRLDSRMNRAEKHLRHFFLLHVCVGTFFGQDTISRELHTSTMNNEPGFINDRSILDKQGQSNF